MAASGRKLSRVARIASIGLSTSVKTPVLLVHGADDSTAPSKASNVADGQLRTAVFSVELEIERRVGHAISLTGVDKTLGF